MPTHEMKPTPQTPERIRLRRFMQTRQRKLGRTWAEIAAKGGVKANTLYRVRVGTEAILPTTRRAIEAGLDWDQGSVDAILAGGDPTPASSSESPEWGQIWVTLPGGSRVMLPVVLERVPGLEDLPEPERRPLLEQMVSRMAHAGWEFLHEEGQKRQKRKMRS